MWPPLRSAFATPLQPRHPLKYRAQPRLRQQKNNPRKNTKTPPLPCLPTTAQASFWPSLFRLACTPRRLHPIIARFLHLRTDPQELSSSAIRDLLHAATSRNALYCRNLHSDFPFSSCRGGSISAIIPSLLELEVSGSWGVENGYEQILLRDLVAFHDDQASHLGSGHRQLFGFVLIRSIGYRSCDGANPKETPRSLVILSSFAILHSRSGIVRRPLHTRNGKSANFPL